MLRFNQRYSELFHPNAQFDESLRLMLELLLLCTQTSRLNYWKGKRIQDVIEIISGAVSYVL